MIAVLQAGLSCKTLISSITLSINENNILIDPSDEEELESDGTIFFVFDCNEIQSLKSSRMNGKMSELQFLECYNSGKSSVKNIEKSIRNLLEN
jgi:ribonuclease PH